MWNHRCRLILFRSSCEVLLERFDASESWFQATLFTKLLNDFVSEEKSVWASEAFVSYPELTSWT